VNNAVYLDWLEEAVVAAAGPDAGASGIDALPRRYRLEYAAAADAGMGLADAVWRDDDGTWSYRLTAAGGAEVFRASIESPGGAT
jgi:hypothetical protein